jgi:colicin import membrane protein
MSARGAALGDEIVARQYSIALRLAAAALMSAGAAPSAVAEDDPAGGRTIAPQLIVPAAADQAKGAPGNGAKEAAKDAAEGAAKPAAKTMAVDEAVTKNAADAAKKAGSAAPDADAKKPQLAKKPPQQEVLPWAAGNAAGGAAAQGDAAKSPGAKPAEAQGVTFGGAAATACQGHYEAACRETPGCSWIADIKLESGAEVKAHCMSRPGTQQKAAKKPAVEAATDKQAKAKIDTKAKPADAAAAAHAAGGSGAAAGGAAAGVPP